MINNATTYHHCSFPGYFYHLKHNSVPIKHSFPFPFTQAPGNFCSILYFYILGLL